MRKDLEAQIAGAKNDLEEARANLTKSINRAQFLATGASLVLVKDPKKFEMMQERLKAFAACVRDGGGDECFKGKR